METYISIHGLTPDLYGLSKVFPQNSANGITLEFEDVGLPDHAGFETHEYKTAIAKATGSFVQEALEKDMSTYKSLAGYWVTDRLNAMGYLGAVSYTHLTLPTIYSV